MMHKTDSLNTIRKKLIGKKITYQEIFDLMDDISHNKLGDILTTYFAASGDANGFSHEELYFLTKAMVETGERLHFTGIVADKHSIGGVPGTRTTLIVVPIIAAAGFIIPKSSSRAITTPDGTADDMEVLASVNLTTNQIYDVVKKTNACIVWGGSVHIAPADDMLIRVEKPLLFESYDKIVVSIMAKKIAFGSNHLVIDLPFGPTVKVHTRKDANILAEKFVYIAKKFDIKISVMIHETDEPAGRGIGPVLEVRESLRVLEQTADRPRDLEKRALLLASELLELCLTDSPASVQEKIKTDFGNAHAWALHLLQSGNALEKMKEIIHAQKGNPRVTSSLLPIGKFNYPVISKREGIVKKINNQNLTIIAKILGAPTHKGAGIYLDKKIGEHVEKNHTLYTMYSESMYNLKEAKDSLINFPISYI